MSYDPLHPQWEDFVLSIDFELFRKQQDWLAYLATDPRLTPEEHEYAEGLLNLLGCVTDLRESLVGEELLPPVVPHCPTCKDRRHVRLTEDPTFNDDRCADVQPKEWTFPYSQYRLLSMYDTLVDMGYIAGEKNFTMPNSRDVTDALISWANEFEHVYANTSWGEDAEYLETLYGFLTSKIENLKV